jgi:MFS family permease
MYRTHIDEGEKRFFYGYVIVAAGFSVWLVAFGTFTAFGVFFKPVLVEFGWTRADTSLGYALAILVMGVVSIPIGWLTDQLGPRIVVTLFGSFLGISYFLMSQMHALWQFHIYYAVLTAIGMSTATAPIMATVARWFARRRGLMTGFVQSGLGIGGLIFSPLVGLLITNHGWRKTYVIIGIITLSGVIISGLRE